MIYLHLLFAVSILQIINGVLVLIFLFLGFKLIEAKWSYKISKPFGWEEAVKKNEISPKIKRLERFYRDKVRFYTIWFQLQKLRNSEGSMAEVGVYKGETANILRHLNPGRRLHLFDTFTGFDSRDLKSETLPDESPDFSDTSLENVRRQIGEDNVFYHQGYFPETTQSLEEEKYVFVHLDADLYQPTLAGLKYFYPRLCNSGVIMIHDYNHDWEGVKKAVDEFESTIPEAVISIPDWQGSVMIIKNKIR